MPQTSHCRQEDCIWSLGSAGCTGYSVFLPLLFLSPKLCWLHPLVTFPLYAYHSAYHGLATASQPLVTHSSPTYPRCSLEANSEGFFWGCSLGIACVCISIHTMVPYPCPCTACSPLAPVLHVLGHVLVSSPWFYHWICTSYSLLSLKEIFTDSQTVLHPFPQKARFPQSQEAKSKASSSATWLGLQCVT